MLLLIYYWQYRLSKGHRLGLEAWHTPCKMHQLTTHTKYIKSHLRFNTCNNHCPLRFSEMKFTQCSYSPMGAPSISKCGALETFIEVWNIAVVLVRQNSLHFKMLMKIPKVGPRSSIRVRAHNITYLVLARTPSSWYQA